MANATKSQKKGTGKTLNKPGKAPATPKVENKTPKNEKVEVVNAEEVPQKVATRPEILKDRHKSGLSMDGQVRLLELAHKVFVEETDPDLQFPKEVRKGINDIVACGTICTIAEHAHSGDGMFAAVIQKQMYPALVATAKRMQIELPDIKALPETTGGDVQILAKDVKVSKETTEQLEKEKKVREGEKPELDPEKITSEEDLRKALEYMFAQRSNKLVDTLVNGIEFMKKFRMHEASLAENSEEAKNKFSMYNSGDWLNDLFAYIKPTVFFTGIGRGMASLISAEKNPVHAFIIFRDAIKDHETRKPALPDQEIAYAAKAIVNWVCNTNIESNKKTIEALDKKKNVKEIEDCKKRIDYYTEIIGIITNPTFDAVDSMIENMGSKFDEGGTLTEECQRANTLFAIVCKSYYDKPLSTCDYKNVAENVQKYAGKIINMFLDAGSVSMKYSDATISELEERTPEEKEELTKLAKKQWAERKKAEDAKKEKNA